MDAFLIFNVGGITPVAITGLSQENQMFAGR